MSFIERIRQNNRIKFSFGKNNEYADIFNGQVNAFSMNNPQYGLNIPSNISLENQLWGVFNQIRKENGIFLFNISAVDLIRAKKGFIDFAEAYDNNTITEWELSIILQNNDYLKMTIFHNGKVELRLTNNGIKIKWI
ncbi:MAG: hypothetical protein Q8R22_01060 [Flavobacterium sp.]|uniref:hypothetical protein n=1 Tax=Flavobacterium sp. TaxID=239 RepID=UPI0027346EB4|nr:hypothetical protein [Flavobacterium sp.]MDP3679405.1 hypothetical protein [Flavobacterium sp.]